MVPPGPIEDAIRARRGYDVTATPNGGRFLAELLLDLARRRQDRRPDGRPFVVRHDDFFPAYLRVTGLTAEEAPPAFRKAHEFGQRLVVEHREDRVIEAVEEGPDPRQALSVRATWPDTRDAASSFTYEDTVSRPNVRVRNERVVTYRLLEYVGFVMYDEMDGVSGRPTTGLLGALFDVIGMAHIEQSRFAVAGDGTQVTLTRVRKVVPTETVATVDPDGNARRGIPDGRPDLDRLLDLLDRNVEGEYAGPPPAACPSGADADRAR